METTVNPREVAQMLGIRLDAVYSLIWAGRLPAEKGDGRWLVSLAAVDARVKSKREQQAGGRKTLRSGFHGGCPHQP